MQRNVYFTLMVNTKPSGLAFASQKNFGFSNGNGLACDY